jgi:hypothetical protein
LHPEREELKRLADAYSDLAKSGLPKGLWLYPIEEAIRNLTRTLRTLEDIREAILEEEPEEPPEGWPHD